MEKILKENEIETVISTVGGANILDQITLVKAMKAVGTIKVFIFPNIQGYLGTKSIIN